MGVILLREETGDVLLLATLVEWAVLVRAEEQGERTFRLLRWPANRPERPPRPGVGDSPQCAGGGAFA